MNLPAAESLPRPNPPLKTPPKLRRIRGALGIRQTHPLTELKSRSKEEIDWACDLDSAMTRAQAIAQIKERLGIDLRWPTTYARFLQWRRQQRIQNGLAARLEISANSTSNATCPPALPPSKPPPPPFSSNKPSSNKTPPSSSPFSACAFVKEPWPCKKKSSPSNNTVSGSEAAPQPPPQVVLARPGALFRRCLRNKAEPPQEPVPIGSSPFTQAKPRQKTQRPVAKSKAKNTTLRRKTQFPSPLFPAKNQAARASKTP